MNCASAKALRSSPSPGYCFSLFGTLPHLFSGAIPNFTDAYFETVSGFTTTGATTLGNMEAVPHGILFWRSMTHWMGGMGIIVFSLAVLPILGIGGMQLYKAEVAGPTTDKLRPRVAETATILWIVYVMITAAPGGVAADRRHGASLTRIYHRFGNVASGGFPPAIEHRLLRTAPYIDWVIIVFMIIGGRQLCAALPFSDWRRWNAYGAIGSGTFSSSAWLLRACLVMISTFTLYADKSAAARCRVPVVSLHTSTGFATADYEGWSSNGPICAAVGHGNGGSAGSTASGGIKVVRIYLVFKYIGQ